jgi:uncharacterized protein (DUF1501 family)
MSTTNHSRRHFLKQGGTLSAASAVGAPWLLNFAAAAAEAASAANPTGYKALVCVFLEGGNDACNTILPQFSTAADDPNWGRYNAVRGTLRQAQLPDGPKANTNDGKSYPLHSSLTNVSELIKLGCLAMVANVGNILPVSGTTTAQTRDALSKPSAQFPPRLRSHNDQTTAWHNGASNVGANGWGGKSAQLGNFDAKDSSANNFRSVVLGNNNAFGVGTGAFHAYGMVRNKGVVKLLDGQGDTLLGGLPVQRVKDVILGKFKTARTNLIEKDYQSVVATALSSQAYMQGLLSAGASVDAEPVPPLNIGGPRFPLAEDLQMVAKVIAGQRAAGVNGRQVFYVSLSGFDIHSDGGMHAKLLKQLDESLNYFRNALGKNMADTLLFTASEFGRLLHANGDGADHGWGGHHFVMGGDIKKGVIHGEVPHYLQINGQYTHPYMFDDGALIPSISVGTYAEQLLKWFGVPPERLTATDAATDVLNGAPRVGNLSLFG